MTGRVRVALVVAACVNLPADALAWEPMSTCGGYNVTWPSPFYLQQTPAPSRAAARATTL